MNLYERNQKQREFFNEKIDTYDDVHSEFMETKNAIVDNLPTDTKKVLDLGAGTGLELIKLFEKFPNIEVTAIDISEEMLKHLKDRDFSNKVKIICGDFFEVDFGGEYDAVISTSALHHFTPNEKNILYKKVYNSLKTNGLFINCDKISLSQDEQDKSFDELNNINNYKHLDTPLTIQNEVMLLKENNFKNVVHLDVDKDNYKLIKANK